MTADRQAAAATVCVVIACYNQARFLPDAIHSVLSQTRAADEIIVVDDGSSDETAAVAGRFAQVSLLQQRNRGLAAARNRGYQEASSDFVVFLDADDRLLPNALASGLAHFSLHPNCAFVAGHYRYVREDGTLLAEHPQDAIDSDAHAAFLSGNWVGMVASVMFRRDAIATAEGFDEGLPAGEDYDLYLRLSRQYPVSRYQAMVAAYRQHSRNMSADISLMLPTILAVLRKNAPPPEDRRRLAAFRAGLKAWKAHYCGIYLQSDPREPGAWTRDAKAILRHAPATMLGLLARRCWRQFRGALRASEGFDRRLWDRLQRPRIGRVRFGALDRPLPLRPDPAASVEGHYVGEFLASVEAALGGCQRGTILFDSRFEKILDGLAGTRGWRRVPLDFSSPAAEENLLTELDRLAASAPRDCLLVLHCLSQVYDLAAAVRFLAAALDSGGLLIATVPGTALGVTSEIQCYRRFTPHALEQLVSGKDWLAAESTAYGNVLTAMGALHGVPSRGFAGRALGVGDPCYPLVIGLKVRRSELPIGAQAHAMPAGAAA